MTRRDLWPLGAIAFVLLVTAAWWGFALWTIPGAPAWLERTRSVCFNLSDSGLPDAKGWLLLLGQPPLMLTFLVVGWRDEVEVAVSHLLASRNGRSAVLGLAIFLATGGALTVRRVHAAGLPDVVLVGDEAAPDTYPRLDRPWPDLGPVVDQTGARFTLESFGNGPAMVAFAFGHCTTVCPVIVHQARQARAELGRDLPIVVFTLDPWRDTPGRLDEILAQFELGAGDFVVGGPVEVVEKALDAWGIPRDRDEVTGDVTHPALLYLVEGDGTIAYGSTGGLRQLVSLAERLRL